MSTGSFRSVIVPCLGLMMFASATVHAQNASGSVADEASLGQQLTAAPSSSDSAPTALGPPVTTFDRLSQQILDPDIRIRVTAVRLLGELEGLEVIARLGRVVRTDPVPEVRGWALHSLHSIGTERARRTAIVTSAGDRDERVSELADELFPDRVAAQASANSTRPGALLHIDDEVVPVQAIRRNVDPSRRLRLGGWFTFGVSYALTFVLGLIVGIGEPAVGFPYLIPLVGPVFSIAIQPDEDYAAVYAMGLISIVAQAIGLGVAIRGHVRYARWRSERRRRQQRRHRALAILPTGPAGPGLSLLASF